MECGQCFPSQPFLVLTVDQFVGNGGGPLETRGRLGDDSENTFAK